MKLNAFTVGARNLAVATLQLIDRDISNEYVRLVCAGIVYALFFLVGLIASALDGAGQWCRLSYDGLMLAVAAK